MFTTTLFHFVASDFLMKKMCFRGFLVSKMYL